MRYYHGSNSASLIGVFDQVSPGLKPIGVLLEEGKIPFCGTLDIGIAENGVRQGISTYEVMHLHKVFEYAMKKCWNPRAAETAIAEAQQDIQFYAEYYAGYDREKYPLIKGNESAAKTRIHIEQQRLILWEQLSSEDQLLIVNAFPIIYGITAPAIRAPLGEGEHIIARTVMLQELTVYAPATEISTTRKRAGQLEAIILPFSELHNTISDEDMPFSHTGLNHQLRFAENCNLRNEKKY